MNPTETETLQSAMHALSTGEYDTAERIFSKLILSGSNMAESLYGLGLIRLHFGQLEAATEQFQGCLKLNPAHANACYYLGVIAENNGQQKAARSYFEQCLAIHPQHVGAAKKLRFAQPPPPDIPGPPPPTPRTEEPRAPSFTPTKEAPRGKQPHSSDFYGLLRSSEEPVEQEIAWLLDSIAAILTTRTQRATGLLNPAIMTLIALDGGLCAAFLAESSMDALTLAFALISVVCCLALVSLLVGARTTKITCDRDWLLLSSGIFSKTVTPAHLFILSRENVSTDQTFINRLTGDGQLLLGKLSLKGFFTPNELAALSKHFRTLSMLNPVGREILAAIGELKQIRSGTN